MPVPSTMKAAAIDHFGGPEAIHVTTLPVPKPSANEVLIQVEAAGVGSWDPDIVSGEFSDASRGFPQVPGSDGAGRIAAVGGRVKKFKVGDRVYGWGFGNPHGGFFAEYAVLNQNDVAKIPKNLTSLEAGVLAVDGITAFEGLVTLKAKKDRTLMIFGANGGVGHLALQLAKRMGARVFAVASGKDGVDLALRIGADAAAEGHDDGIVALAEEFAPDGFDAALVVAGGNGWKRELQLVKKGGLIAYPHGVEPEPQAPTGVRLRGYDGTQSPEAFERLNRLIGTRPFHVEVSRIYPLEEAAQALRDVRRHHLGKLAVQVTA